jgi:phospholipase/carboxylesterase
VSAEPGSRSRLTFRPPPAPGEAGEPGDAPLRLDPVRDGLLYIPDTANAAAPVLVFFHGAGGTGRRELRVVMAAADRYGVVVVAPDSRGPTWDVIVAGGFADDPPFIDRALEAAAGRCDADFGRLAAGGVSDGASYALSIGLTNGDLFEAVISFSPGFIAPGELIGRPRIFVSHGVTDPILPIDGCSRRIVPLLKEAGYDVTYREFDGGHTVPPTVSDEALRWWVGLTA